MTRRRNFRIFRDHQQYPLSGIPPNDSSDQLLAYDSEDTDSGFEESTSTKRYPSKKRNCCGRLIRTPNTSRFRNNLHSRILQRFPFLVEMFYWIINYAFYRFTSIASQALFAGKGIWNVAQAHGISVLTGEESGPLSFLFPIREREVQQWFMHGHQTALTTLNKAYALIHIPGTVG